MSEDQPGKLEPDIGPPFSNVVSLHSMSGDDEQDTALLREHFTEACEYLLSFDWCVSIVDSYFGDGVGGIAAAFLFRILPARTGIDEWLWVVVGDFPPAYFVTEDIKSPHDALTAYILHRSTWVEAVLGGRILQGDVMPVSADRTREVAEALSKRLKILSEQVLPYFRS
jgi:hypothetical protein